ncbi:MAG: MmcQ/YjbR family DNA-binding protein [Gemmataceae bacterium]
MKQLRKAAAATRKFALGLPGAYEEFPWGESVAKVNKKVFIFMGLDVSREHGFRFSVKLPVTGREALELPFTEPTGYGLGKSGWVTATFMPGQPPPIELIREWIEESYRAVAPKKLVAQLELGHK